MVELSEYEKIRQERIVENQKQLKKLGLASIIPQPKKKTKKRAPPTILRRSTRNKKLEIPDQSPPIFKERIPTIQLSTKSYPIIPEINLPIESLHVGETRSSKELQLCFDHFHQDWLGKQLLPQGKFPVMSAMCQGFVPKFGKMSGIQPWKNAMVLFVNIDDTQAYENMFHHVRDEDLGNRIYMNWFAQTRQTEESPSIVRLLCAKSGDKDLFLEKTPFKASQKKIPERVLLFCRLKSGPYIYCGRLGYLGHLVSFPIEFRWQLLDAPLFNFESILDVFMQMGLPTSM